MSRVIEIDTTGGPAFGSLNFKQHDFLRNGEVVLTFDDGPLPNNTSAVIKALADECVKATFFPIGKFASHYPEILKQILEGGHSIGSQTWSHWDLSRESADEGKEEIEKGIGAITAATGQPITPFFRFPALRQTPEAMAYLGRRNIGILSADIAAFEFEPSKLIKSILEGLTIHGKGIVRMQESNLVTAEALPDLLKQLKRNGYKIVHIVGRSQVVSLPRAEQQSRPKKSKKTAAIPTPAREKENKQDSQTDSRKKSGSAKKPSKTYPYCTKSYRTSYRQSLATARRIGVVPTAMIAQYRRQCGPNG